MEIRCLSDRLDSLERQLVGLAQAMSTQAGRVDGRFETLVGLIRTTTADLRSVLKTTHDALDRRLVAIERVCRTGRRSR